MAATRRDVPATASMKLSRVNPSGVASASLGAAGVSGAVSAAGGGWAVVVTEGFGAGTAATAAGQLESLTVTRLVITDASGQCVYD